MLALVYLAALLNPVDGPVLRAFAGGPDPFAAGLHRGVLLESARGAAVRAPCRGRVRFAGATPRGPAVTIRCGSRLVTVMPVEARAARGAPVRRGGVLGRARGPVRLSVRERGAYLDPEPLLAAPPAPFGPAPPPRAVPRPLPPRERPAPAPPAMPWPAWAGAALLLAIGASALRLRARSARAPRLEPAIPRRAA